MADSTQINIDRSDPRYGRPIIVPYDPKNFGDGRRAAQKCTEFYQSLSKLQEGLKLGDKEDVKKWMETGLFKPFFDRYLRECVEPARQKNNGRIPTGANFAEIRNAIKLDDAGGFMKYSGQFVDTSEFELIDHQAYFLRNCTEVNIRNSQGILRPSDGFNFDTAMWAVWQAFRWKMNQETPEKIRERRERMRSKESSANMPPPGSQSQDKDLGFPTQNVQQNPFASLFGRSSNNAATAEKQTPDLFGSNPGPTNSIRDHVLTTTDNRSLLASEQTAEKRKIDHADSNNPAKRQSSGLYEPPPHPEADGDPEHGESPDRPESDGTISGDDNPNPHNNQDDDTTVITRTPFDECKEDWPTEAPFNLQYRHCRIIATHMICNTQDLQMDPWLVDNIQRLSLDDDIMEWNEQSQQWLKEQVAELGANKLLDIAAPTQAEISEFFEYENFMNYKPTIQVDLQAIKRTLKAEGGARPRVQGMPFNQKLTDLQLLGVHDIMAFRTTLKGCILADSMGLGKTVQMICTILQINNERARLVQSGAMAGPAKPHLLVVPGNLIEQFCEELHKFAPTALKVYIYHGDARAKRRAHLPIIASLDKDAEIFNGQESNAKKVILSTINTLDSRHGPQVLKIWRQKQGMSNAQAMAEYNKPDYNCPKLLPNRFETVIVDEAHCVKRLDSSYSQVIQWLRPNFTLLATATPAMNSCSDWEGYLPFVQPRTPVALGMATPGNPYLTNSNSTASDRLDMAKASQYIFTNPNPLEKGTYLRVLQDACTIMRTYSTTINGHKVGEALPALLQRRIEPSFPQPAQKLYKKWSVVPLRKLIRSEGIPPNNKLMWNQKNFRHLVLLTMWLGFEALLDDVLSENLGAIKNDPSVLQKWMKKVAQHRRQQGLEYDLPNDLNDSIALIKKIVSEAPKLSIILSLLSDEVATLKENIVIWSLFPGIQIFLWVVLQHLNYKVMIVSSDMTGQERNQVTTEFGRGPGQSKVLLVTYALSSFGLNLQGGCHIDIHSDIAISEQVKKQAQGRIRRIGQSLNCISYSVSVQRTFNDRQVSNVLSKAFGTAITALNPTIFNVTAKEDVDGDVQVTMGNNFVLADGKLTTAGSQAATNAVEVKALAPEDIIKWILHQSLGKRVTTDLDRDAENDVDSDDEDGAEDEDVGLPDGMENFINVSETDEMYD